MREYVSRPGDLRGKRWICVPDPLYPEITDIQKWLLELAADYRVLVPAASDGGRVFREINALEQPAFGLPQERTLLPAKKVCLPPEASLFEFQEGEILPAAPPEKTIIFGLHVCELSADRLLLDNMACDRPDRPFLERRAETLVAGVSCKRNPGCFCEKTGHDRVAPGDFDLFLELPDDSSQTGRTQSATPRLLTGSAAGRKLAREAPFGSEDAIEEIIAPSSDQAWPLADLPAMMRASFGAPMWDELAARCLGCGNCTIVCPLCYCFYTRDETGLDPSGGKRLRLWDSCQLIAFARVAGGHNFREARSERIWYRFSHKFMRTQEALGRPGCSGCGACFHYCPVDIDPREVIASVMDVTTDAPG